MGPRRFCDMLLAGLCLFLPRAPRAGAAPTSLRAELEISHVLDTGGRKSMRIDLDPVSGSLYYLRTNGSVFRVTLGPGEATSGSVFTSAETGITAPQGFAFGPDGALYILGNQASGAVTTATIRRGVRVSAGSEAREWTTLARTVPYPLGGELFNHLFGGIAVSPDGLSVYASSGSRTDHGEVEDHDGTYPGLRELPLTACMLRLPANGIDILLENDEGKLRAAGYLFARGLRNSFDLAFTPEGELLATENSGDRDDSEELNWIREGGHYGFPWRMGSSDTPQATSGYVPDSDPLIDRGYYAWTHGLFHDDPSYPPPPAGIVFTDPIENEGPDADQIRDPATGQILDASALGMVASTFTAHRSPLGLVFDTPGELAGAYRGKGFVLGWTEGDPAGDSGEGPFKDPGEDLLQLDLTATNGSYRARVTRIVRGFANPVDAVLAGSRLYVLEYGGEGGIWEIAFPSSEPSPRYRRGFVNGDDGVDVGDAVSILLHLFAGLALACPEAADTNGDAVRNVADAIFLLDFLYLDGPAPPAPFGSCGAAESPETSCRSTTPCA